MKTSRIFILFLVPLFLFGAKYGLGIILGTPTGFTGKYMFAKRSAVVLHVGWSFAENEKFHCTGDYQFLFPTTIRYHDEYEDRTSEITNLIPFVGIGGSLLFRDVATNGVELQVGVRFGGGLEYMLSRFGLFLEIYPVVNIVPETDFDLEGGLGCHFYF